MFSIEVGAAMLLSLCFSNRVRNGCFNPPPYGSPVNSNAVGIAQWSERHSQLLGFVCGGEFRRSEPLCIGDTTGEWDS